jgi:tetratricopeptide (TPR) repeat protein
MVNQVIVTAQRTLALATASGDVVLHALANHSLGVAYRFQGDYPRAIDCFRQTVAALDGSRRRERFGRFFFPAVESRVHLASCYADLGTFPEGNTLGEEGLRIAEEVAHPGSVMIASRGIGGLFLRQGDLPRALPRLERALGFCQDADLKAFFPVVATALGTAYTLAGRVAEAVPLLTEALEQTIARERIVSQALCHIALGEAYVLAGRVVEAHALAERALALAHKYQQRMRQAYALRLLGDIAARREPPESALATLYATIGQQEQARAELSAAIVLYHAMDMTFWLPQAEAALAEVEGR